LKSRLSLLSTILSILLISSLVLSGCASTSTITTTSTPVTSTSITATPSVVHKEIMVFAGSASKPPLDEAAQIFEKQTGISVYINYGGSGTMLSQMELSKMGDIYIPGSPDYLVKAEGKNITDPTSTKILTYLIPVISVQHGNPKNIQSLTDLAKPGIKIGIGNPSTVCVGLYAIEILDKNNLLRDVYKNIITNAESCDKTATLISLKSVDAVFGWDVFHYWDPANIDTVYLKPEQISRIAYIPAAISTFTKDKVSSAAFIDFLASQAGQDIFKKWGYITSETEAKTFAPNATIGGEYNLSDSYNALVK
jgi:molybdate transport system substrate-binding protein